MRITFRYTNDEYQQYRQLNRTVATPRWKSYLLALLCLIPSFCLILATNSLIAILAASTILISVLGIAIVAAIGDKPIVDKHNHLLTLDESTAHENQSHSQWQTRWDYYDSFDETDSLYLLGRLDRFTAIPKRALEADQLEQFISYCNQVGTEDNSATDASPVNLFSELFTDESQSKVYQFAYSADDLSAAMSDNLKIVDTSGSLRSDETGQPKSHKRQRLLGTFWLLVLFSILFYIVFSAPGQMPQSEQWTWLQIFCLFLAILLPFRLMKWLNHWFASKQKRNAVRIPTDPISMQLMSNGWAIGNQKSCQFFDWRDVEAFYQNKFCFGFHTFNDLVQIIPRRIFSQQDESEQFINQAISLRREHLRSYADTAVGVETGNPYQAPIS